MTKNIKDQKCAYITLIGAPNAGKSTLLNQFLGQKLAIVSPKAQTTRTTLKGIMIEGNTQLIFIDTPGVFKPKQTRPLERSIVKTAWGSVREAEIICLLIDAKTGITKDVRMIIENLKNDEKRTILVLNKIDLIKKEKLLVLTAELDAYGIFDCIFMISAKTGEKVGDLKKYLIDLAPHAPWQYGEEEITDAPMKFLAAEITREKLFLNLHNDLPYSVNVETETWEELKDGSIKIQQVIYVLKEGQKNIVVGHHGSMIKKIGQEARQEIGELIEKKVHLYLFVKVKSNWVDRK